MPHFPSLPGPIGVFDSGYGGLTILRQIRETLPAYDYIYLGDNARTPYGTRSFEIVYEFTRQAVVRLFEMGCPLVILACNTASAKALRSIQMNDLPRMDASRRVLGVIRPTVESIGAVTQTRHVGVLATSGTIKSESYPMEIHKLFPDITVYGQACPMWVPLVENDEAHGPGADYFVQKYIDELLQKDERIDTAILGCTHYPLLLQEGLPPPPPRNGRPLYARRHVSLLHHGSRREVCRIGLALPEPGRRSETHPAGVSLLLFHRLPRLLPTVEAAFQLENFVTGLAQHLGSLLAALAATAIKSHGMVFAQQRIGHDGKLLIQHVNVKAPGNVTFGILGRGTHIEALHLWVGNDGTKIIHRKALIRPVLLLARAKKGEKKSHDSQVHFYHSNHIKTNFLFSAPSHTHSRKGIVRHSFTGDGQEAHPPRGRSAALARKRQGCCSDKARPLSASCPTP